MFIEDDLAIFNKVCEKYGIKVAGECEPKVYVDAKELAGWLVEKYGARTGAVSAAVFDIIEHISQMEKLDIKERELHG